MFELELVNRFIQTNFQLEMILTEEKRKKKPTQTQ